MTLFPFLDIYPPNVSQPEILPFSIRHFPITFF